MHANAFRAEAGFARLRRRIAEIEGRGSGFGEAQHACQAEIDDSGGKDGVPALTPLRAGALLPFAIPRLDRVLAGGLRRDACHEIRGAFARDIAAATGFASAILARLTRRDDRPVLWIVEAAAGREAGLPYGAGLDRFGLDSRRLIVVRVRKAGDALWVFEEGLSCRGLAAVLGELRGEPRRFDLTASRRLALRAQAGGVMGLLLRHSDRIQPGAAATRWLVAPRPTATLDDCPVVLGGPAWRLTLERNRLGATGTFDLEWDHGRCCFVPVATDPPHSLPVAAVPADRSHPARGRAGPLARAS